MLPEVESQVGGFEIGHPWEVLRRVPQFRWVVKDPLRLLTPDY